jgi:anaerobic ribonucleoside-triphosphate reductase
LESSVTTQDFAASVIAHLNAEAERLSAKHKARFCLAESRDPNASHRLAKLDFERFGATDAIDPHEAHYTNAAKVPATRKIGALEKLRIEGVMQQNALFGSASELWGDKTVLRPEQMAVLVSRAFYQTNNSAFTLSPEFTLCLACHALTAGLVAECPNCHSTKLDTLALATSHYSRVSLWPRWKVADFKLRKRELVP